MTTITAISAAASNTDTSTIHQTLHLDEFTVRTAESPDELAILSTLIVRHESIDFVSTDNTDVARLPQDGDCCISRLVRVPPFFKIFSKSCRVSVSVIGGEDPSDDTTHPVTLIVVPMETMTMEDVLRSPLITVVDAGGKVMTGDVTDVSDTHLLPMQENVGPGEGSGHVIEATGTATGTGAMGSSGMKVDKTRLWVSPSALSSARVS